MGVLKQEMQAALDSMVAGQFVKAGEILLAALAQPERKPLTDADIELAYREIWRNLSDGFSHTSAEWIEAGIRYAEKAHGIGDKHER